MVQLDGPPTSVHSNASMPTRPTRSSHAAFLSVCWNPCEWKCINDEGVLLVMKRCCCWHIVTLYVVLPWQNLWKISFSSLDMTVVYAVFAVQKRHLFQKTSMRSLSTSSTKRASSLLWTAIEHRYGVKWELWGGGLYGGKRGCQGNHSFILGFQ